MQILLERTLSGLRAGDLSSAEELQKLAVGQAVRADIARMRNPQQLRLYWALIGLCHQHQSYYATREDLSDAIKIAVGHCQEVRLRDGRTAVRAKSIAFGNLPQDQWEDFFDRVIALVCEKIIPNTTDAELRAHLEDMTGAKVAA